MPVRPVVLFLLLRSDAERDPAVQRHHFKLDIEAFAIAVRPCAADSRPESFLAFSVAYLVGDMRRCFGSRFVVVRVRHNLVLSRLVYQPRPSRPDGTSLKAARAGAQRTGQAENWGRPSGGADFPLERTGGGFSVPMNRPWAGDPRSQTEKDS